MVDEQGKGGQVFVTVGTTLFDALVKEASSQQCRQILADLGYSSLLIQRGKGSFTPVEVKTASLLRCSFDAIFSLSNFCRTDFGSRNCCECFTGLRVLRV